MKHFIKKVIVFLILPILVLLIPITFFLFHGEFGVNMAKVVTANDKKLVGFIYNEAMYQHYKWLLVNDRPRAKVLGLGSSRVLGFTNKMFKKETEFLNAGYAVNSVNDFKVFLQSLPEQKLPNTLLISLDFWMFNKAHDNLSVTKASTNYTSQPNFFPETKHLVQLYKDWFNKKMQLTYSGDNELLGLNSRLYKQGFLRDGSFYYGGQINKLLAGNKMANDFEFANTIDRIKQGKNRFEFGEHINKAAVDTLVNFLNYCKQKQIKVVAVMPPFADTIYHLMEKSSKHNYINEIEQSIQPVFSSYGYELHIFNNASSVKATDNEMIDGFHGSEVVYTKTLLAMLRNNSVLNNFADSTQIKQQLKQVKNRFEVL